MTTSAERVAELHELFRCPIRSGPPPHPLPLDEVQLRIRLIREEAAEVIEALESGDPAAVAAELADLLYVVYGTGVQFGMDLDAVLAEVHRANLTKLDADGRCQLGSDGKILKGDRYVPPNVAPLLERPAREG